MATSGITTIDQLQAIYGEPADASVLKEVNYVAPHYRALIEASPFAVLATSGPEGLDCSPRGDVPGFVRVDGDKTLLLPDRRGNNRVDSLRNIIREARAALLFLIPGIGQTLRVNGRASLSVDAEMLASFAMDDNEPRCVIVLSVDAVYFQCARTVVRSDLWNPEKHIDPKSLPTPGQMLAELSDKRIGGDEYDRAWANRAKQTLW